MPTQSPSLCLDLHVNTVAALTGRSVRTWQRRMEQGLVVRQADGRALVPWTALQAELVAPLAPQDAPLLARADQGEAAAQAQMGALLALAALDALGAAPGGDGGNGCSSCVVAARYFLEQAAQQGEADAMHWLALLHAAGLCEGDGNAQALMWLARAAAQGHVLAKAQLAGLMPGAGV
ncbi:MAG: hypothetical protein ABS45_14110 [Comamonas sp. SCN 65-56]|uniref:hypothetical protein n=1 Tax=Comamonas sp. SCN 65-56 TaxID=1660095 RepID=UPI00086B68AE|nr:hypothetical protein [Comamonas sp. SCN 65-56]ODS90790.1 MAG: hypothetical protein ABS45_14110 [Comamonas sp. SCN 65-56]